MAFIDDIKPIDVMAFDVIGWDPVPEPASAVLIALGPMAIASGRIAIHR